MLDTKDIKAKGTDKQVKDLLDAKSRYEVQIANLESQLKQYQSALKESEKTVNLLIEQLKLTRQQMYGKKSEKVNVNQEMLFNEFEDKTNPKADEPKEDEILVTRKRKRGGKRKIDYSKYETEVIEHDIDEDKKFCPVCKNPLKKISEQITRRVRIIPAKVIIEKHHIPIYRCSKCCEDNKNGQNTKSVLLRAPLPKLPINNSFATPSLIAWLIYGKYVNAMPLYRIEEDLKTLGIIISRQNMSNWVIGTFERWFSLIYTRMKEKLLESKRMHADETSVQVLKEKGRDAHKKSTMWLFCSAACDTPIYIYQYNQSRSKKVIKDFLGDWAGTLTTDGYSPYYSLGSNITNVSCGVHIRRYFAKIVQSIGGDIKAEALGSIALVARQKIDEIFHVDSGFDDMDADKRKRVRNIKLRPLMEAFYEWASEQLIVALPGSALHKALKYAVTYWPYLMNVLDDGHLELDNNIAERAIKPFVIGRKNWLFCNTVRGADASAAIYSIVTTAKENNLNTRLYVEWLLDKMPNATSLSETDLDNMLPWSQNIPKEFIMDKESKKA